jgi:hypothetical protein
LSGPKVAQPARLAVSNPELVKIMAGCISPANKKTINAARPPTAPARKTVLGIHH